MTRKEQEWLATRPVSIQTLAMEFPINSLVKLPGAFYHILGYTEEDLLILTPINPAIDYDAAMECRTYLCASHLRGLPS